MSASARARLPWRVAAWLAAGAVALALAAACCSRDVPLGVSPTIDARYDAAADG
jgi:hypothetical protein